MKRLAIVAVLLSWSFPTHAQMFDGVARAVDGDSLVVAGRQVRLFGIDAPEYRQTCRVGWSNWSCGSDAAAALRSMIESQHLTCEPRDIDVYGRTVARCSVDGLDVAGALIDRGMAITLDNAPQDYVARQVQSKGRQAGIWASEFEAPAQYRAANPRASVGQAPQPAERVTVRAVSLDGPSAGSFRNCAEARAAGAAPLRIGRPGYGAHLDRDGDGIACEPYRGR